MTGDNDFLDQPEQLDTAARVHRVLHSGQMRPAFRDRLRTDLVALAADLVTDSQATQNLATDLGTGNSQAARKLATDLGTGDSQATQKLAARRPRPRWAPRRPVLAAGLAVAAALVVTLAVVFGTALLPTKAVSVSATSQALGAVSLAPDDPLRLRFDHPVDHRTVEAALHLTPATSVRPSWAGDVLTVAPEHGLAPNTAYVLTIDRKVARTTSGAPLASDITVPFGTAPAVTATPHGAPVALTRTRVAAADDGSEAVVTRDGSLLLTAAKPGASTGNHSGLVRVHGGAAVKLSAATSAICVSRSGDSIAFLAGADIVFADSVGTAVGRAPVTIDDGSPLGWINDAEVTFVGGGRLRAMNRAGAVRTLSDQPIDAARDQLGVAPGGRYAYTRKNGEPGQLIDLVTGAAHPLPGITGDPAFSADGGTVIWVDGSGGAPRIALAPSGGGPVLASALPVQPGDRVGDLAVAPDAARFVYSVTGADGREQLRLAALPDGATLAVSSDGAGASPNWSPSGNLFTIQAGGPAGPRIETVTGPAPDRSALAGPVAAFANAQTNDDRDAQRSLAAPGVNPPGVNPSGVHPTRAAVLWVLPAPDGTVTARVRLTRDASPANPVVTQAEETLTVAGGVVRAVTLGQFRPVPPEPQVARLDVESNRVRIAFDSDLDPTSVAASVRLLGTGGTANVSYDPSTRTVIVDGPLPTAGAVIELGTGLRDVAGRHPHAEARLPI